jgi:hypothetical protein
MLSSGGGGRAEVCTKAWVRESPTRAPHLAAMFRLEYHARITRRLVGLTGDDSLRRDADAGGALLEVVDDLERVSWRVELPVRT